MPGEYVSMEYVNRIQHIAENRMEPYDVIIIGLCKEIRRLKSESYLSNLESIEKVLQIAVKHIEGKADTFSEREKAPVLFQLNRVLESIQGEIRNSVLERTR